MPKTPEIHTYVAIGPHCWAKGETPQEAKTNARKFLPSKYRRKRKLFNVYRVPADARVNAMGDTVWDNANHVFETCTECHVVEKA